MSGDCTDEIYFIRSGKSRHFRTLIFIGFDVRKRRAATAVSAKLDNSMKTRNVKSMETEQAALAYQNMATPVGLLKLVASDEGLVAILWENDDPQRVRVGALKKDEGHPVLVETVKQLKEYFAGQRKQFSVKLDFRGTEFQRKVWAALVSIPFGTTRSYAQIAEQVGSPKAVRAVGAANGRNPISIIAPCHRVIGKDGKLTGFAGGLEVKAFLLGMEGRQLHEDAVFEAMKETPTPLTKSDLVGVRNLIKNR